MACQKNCVVVYSNRICALDWYNSYLLGIVAEPPNYKKLLGSVLMISGPLIGCLLSKWKSERAKLRVPAAVILICIVINFLILK